MTHAVRQEYDDLAPHYDRRWRPYIDATLDSVMEVLKLQGEEAVLDVPCGTGELTQRLTARWPDLRITGVDLSPAMLQQAGRKDKQRRVTWLEADVSDLPLADRTFDCVICANSFHYFRAPEHALIELRRVLRPGGKFVLLDWCDDFFACKVCSLWLRWKDPAFFRTYSLRDCCARLQQAEFEIQRADRFRIGWVWGMMRLVCRCPPENEAPSR
jgi:ubiquinone/menaquinone biosynthesis C-methylase UbiE